MYSDLRTAAKATYDYVLKHMSNVRELSGQNITHAPVVLCISQTLSIILLTVTHLILISSAEPSAMNRLTMALKAANSLETGCEML